MHSKNDLAWLPISYRGFICDYVKIQMTDDFQLKKFRC